MKSDYSYGLLRIRKKEIVLIVVVKRQIKHYYGAFQVILRVNDQDGKWNMWDGIGS